MKGIQFWAYTHCRSTLAFYAGLAKFFRVPFRICVGVLPEHRLSLGWRPDEFESLPVVHTEFDFTLCKTLLHEKSDWHQFFGTYQKHTVFNWALKSARKSCPGVGIGSEAPLNMIAPGAKRILKHYYLQYYLPLKLRPLIQCADFLINYSGYFKNQLLNPGWPLEKVIPAGYFPPPLEGSSFRDRILKQNDGKRKVLFVSGGESWHRGTDILPATLLRLQSLWGQFEMIVSGKGPLKSELREKCERMGAPIRFVGFLDSDKLIRYYETCYAFLALGREEPWGIRVNDAVNCGAPLVISKGMGAYKIVVDHNCGWIFDGGSVSSLYETLCRVISDQDDYYDKVKNTKKANRELLPAYGAKEVGKEITSKFCNWH